MIQWQLNEIAFPFLRLKREALFTPNPNPNNNKTMKNKSWKTTVAGIFTFLAVLAPSVTALLDGVESTVPDWGLVVAAAIAMFGLVSARDNNVSSEEAGAK